MQRFLRALYPPLCIGCSAEVESEFALCGACWRETPFLTGLACAACGQPLPGAAAPGEAVLCDDCIARPKPWSRGAAALAYDGMARRLILRLKHGDRSDLARPLGNWLARAARPLARPGMVVAPVPLHRWRLARRRYNQAALLSRQVARALGLDHVPDLLARPVATPMLDGLTREGRQAALAGAIRPHPRRAAALAGRPVLLIDDVMTTGATLAAAAEACRAGGATELCVAALARVAKDA